MAALWELVDDGAGFDEVLDALISGGLRELPGFVLVSEFEADTKVVIRGAARASFTADDETVDLEGSSATTWVERSLTGVTGMVIEVEDADADDDDLPIDNGLVRVGRVDAPPYARRAGGRARARGPRDPTPSRRPSPPRWPPWPQARRPTTSPRSSRGPDRTRARTGPTPRPRSRPPAFSGAGPADAASRRSRPHPRPPTTDHDGMTRAGSHDPSQFAPPQPGIPGQPPAPSITRPVARLVFSSGQTVEVDRADPDRPRPRGAAVPVGRAAPPGHACRAPTTRSPPPTSRSGRVRRRPRLRRRHRPRLDQRHRAGPAGPAARGPPARHRRPADPRSDPRPRRRRDHPGHQPLSRPETRA